MKEEAKERARVWLHNIQVGDGYPLEEEDVEKFTEQHWVLFIEEEELQS